MTNKIKPKIVVIGGGFGGLETAFYLRMRLPDQADITLVSDRDYFLFKPNTIYIPFGLNPERLKIGLEQPTKCKNISFVRDRAREIDPVTKTVHTAGQKLSYDFLVVATGAGMYPDEVPGLHQYARTIWTPENMLQLRREFNKLLEDSWQDQPRQVLFLVPPNNKYSGPLYEMVFMLDTWLRRKARRHMVNLVWSTYETGYIQAFGPRLHEVVTKEFEQREVTGYTQYAVKWVGRNGVVYQNGQSLPFDLLVSFPPYAAATTFPGLPSDERGFIATEQATRQVLGHPEIYAVGDAANFPVKQAFLALLQADASAEHLATTILETQPAFSFDPVSRYVLEEFNTATFAQVPLRLTNQPDKPIEVRSEMPELYKVGTSPVWRLGKKLLGVYLPRRFSAGNPCHAGLPWQGMEVGLNLMSNLLAH